MVPEGENLKGQRIQISVIEKAMRHRSKDLCLFALPEKIFLSIPSLMRVR